MSVMIRLLYELGARIQDLTELKFSDFTYDSHTKQHVVSWYNKKTAITRKVYVS